MIKGNNIFIRTIKEEDLKELFSLLNDIESKGSFLPTHMQSESKFKNEFNSTGFITESSEKYVILSNTDGIVGLIWAFKSVPYFDAIEIGFHVFNKDNRNKGIATEAVMIFTNFIFESKQVNRVEIRMATGNNASERVAKKSGFKHEGTNRQAAFSKGRHFDMHIYALLRSEWSCTDAVSLDT